MGKLDCFGDKVGAFFVGMILLVIGIIFVIVSFTVLPVLGLIVAIPALIIAAMYLKTAYKAACEYRGM